MAAWGLRTRGHGQAARPEPRPGPGDTHRSGPAAAGPGDRDGATETGTPRVKPRRGSRRSPQPRSAAPSPPLRGGPSACPRSPRFERSDLPVQLPVHGPGHPRAPVHQMPPPGAAPGLQIDPSVHGPTPGVAAGARTDPLVPPPVTERPPVHGWTPDAAPPVHRPNPRCKPRCTLRSRPRCTGRPPVHPPVQTPVHGQTPVPPPVHGQTPPVQTPLYGRTPPLQPPVHGPIPRSMVSLPVQEPTPPAAAPVPAPGAGGAVSGRGFPRTGSSPRGTRRRRPIAATPARLLVPGQPMGAAGAPRDAPPLGGRL
ncbi:basic proline-rich protein-like [Caloenas nicobarica]|uniref:basic proline-rich protein-like n=1 Tax=Caloenas nicobarica TaxID=187106 RepID=UPI0032B7FAA8